LSDSSNSIRRDCNSIGKSELSSSGDNTKSANCTLCSSKEQDGCENKLVIKRLMNQNYCCYHHNNKNHSGCDDQDKYSFYRVITNYWKINNKKRLSLLWQWSVSMGYSEYNHAKMLKHLVLQLQSSRENLTSQDNNNETSFLQAEEDLIQSNREKQSNQVVIELNNIQSSNDKSERIL
jgi:hypothetical protein